MHLAYPSIRFDHQDVEQYLAWHTKYPVSDDERRRNHKIEALIGRETSSWHHKHQHSLYCAARKAAIGWPHQSGEDSELASAERELR